MTNILDTVEPDSIADGFDRDVPLYSSETVERLLAEHRKQVLLEAQAAHDHEDVLAPVGNSAYGEAYQDGWIAGTAAYRDELRRMAEGEK
jgi:hypothetical protein